MAIQNWRILKNTWWMIIPLIFHTFLTPCYSVQCNSTMSCILTMTCAPRLDASPDSSPPATLSSPFHSFLHRGLCMAALLHWPPLVHGHTSSMAAEGSLPQDSFPGVQDHRRVTLQLLTAPLTFPDHTLHVSQFAVTFTRVTTGCFSPHYTVNSGRTETLLFFICKSTPRPHRSGGPLGTQKDFQLNL